MSDRDLRGLYENVRRGDKYYAPDNISNLYSKVINEMAFEPVDEDDSYEADFSSTDQPVNIQASLKEFIVNIQKLAKTGMITPEDITYFNKHLTEKPFRSQVEEYLINNCNITRNLMSTNDPVEAIMTYLGNYDCFPGFLKYIEQPLSLSQLGAMSGNLFSMLSKTGLPNDFLLDLMELNGMENGRGVGKAELFMSSMFSDVKQTGDEGAGDCTWNGRYLEIKGTAARLGGRDDYVDIPSDIVSMANNYGVDLSEENTKSGIALSEVIYGIWQGAQAIDKKQKTTTAQDQAIKSIDNFIRKAYPNHDVNISPEAWDWNDRTWAKRSGINGNGLRGMTTCAYFRNYVIKHSIDYMCLVNTKKDKDSRNFKPTYSTFHIFPIADVEKIVRANPTITGVVKTKQLGPNLNAIKSV